MNKAFVGVVILGGLVVCGWAILGYAQDQGRVTTNTTSQVEIVEDTESETEEYIPSSAPTGVCGGAEGGCGGNCGGAGCGGSVDKAANAGGGCGCGG